MNYVIIVAGGMGARMNADVPKQFLLLHGKPILLRTIEAFYQYSSSLKIILGLPEDYIKKWEDICHHHKHPLKETIVVGGATRFQTVKRCLDKITDLNGCVAIHDGVRPFVTKKIIEDSFREAKKGTGAVASLTLKESLRTIKKEGFTLAVDRNEYILVQTPQTFPVNLIKEAYKQQEYPYMTDDAVVAERAGFAITLIPGSERNIKITTPMDLKIANVLYNQEGD